MTTFWTTDDYLAGRCEEEAVGTRRPEEAAAPALEEEPEPCAGEPAPDALEAVLLDPEIRTLPFRQRLEMDVEQAYLAAGGPAYLARQPGLLNKLIQRVLPVTQAVPAPVPEREKVPEDWPDWLTARRLAYDEEAQRTPRPQLEVDDVESRPVSPFAPGNSPDKPS